ncbi:SDR family oxidoreductase [Microbacterium sp. cf332]|uniref:SDR family oxidoreductase n=1 Tax=Microbacterium sp. cf332 TaxID=1761804 RepID=UPI0008918838|nr:SDR family NAD(P)-dependent oxidoreductase [Microbacterium sp. cf332]SDQ48167.1 Short-chain dehydrogenase involved in D-alanine esterification of teichoic acids [Microbacterium sp. cf332]
MDITGRTVFIPGATSGIGRALAIALAERGNTVIVGGRRRELIDDLRAAHPAIDGVEIDTSDAASIDRAAAEVLERHPGLDVLITMAGVMAAEDWTSPAGFVETAERTVTTNLLGPIRLIGAFIEHLLTRPAATIMTVSSGLAFAPLRVTPTYNATKAAIHMLSESLRLQYADTPVSIVELVPPAVQTDLMPGHAENPHAQPLDDYIAEVVAILERDADVREVLVERVTFLRHGEARGDYADVVRALNASDPHAQR